MADDTRDLLIEIGTEELPPKALFNLSLEFERGIAEGLEKAGLAFKAIRRFATPRRLAVQIDQLPTRQPDRQLERRGPTLSAAFGPNGQPTKAAEGFARSCGVTVAELQRQETDKGAWLVHVGTEKGAPTAELIPAIVEAYRQGAINAKTAGFDGVELHGANGYLLDQFLQDSTNRRTDRYGGSIENRARLLLEVTDAAIGVWGAGRVGVHLAPRCDAHTMGDSDPLATFSYVARELGKRKIAFIFARESQAAPGRQQLSQ